MSLFDQINTEESAEDKATGEKHAPVITIEDLGDNKHRVKIDVGEGKHPNEIDHWIQWVELRANNLYIGRAEFSAKILDPVAEFIVNCPGECKFSAIARCNKHGLWEGKASCK